MKSIICLLLIVAAFTSNAQPSFPFPHRQRTRVPKPVAASTDQGPTTTCFMHLNLADNGQRRRNYGIGYQRRYNNIVGFVIHNIDTNGNDSWQSPLITTYDKDSTDWLVKVDIPILVLQNSRKAWCEAYIKRPFDTSVIKYGGVSLSKIKLYLKSTPEGAETFLIPNRIWSRKIENSDWQNNSSLLECYRVNTSSTNTYSYVDETVFVVLYKYQNRFKKIIHYTKPVSVESEQTAWVQF